jgi:hypothetical protein
MRFTGEAHALDTGIDNPTARYLHTGRRASHRLVFRPERLPLLERRFTGTRRALALIIALARLHGFSRRT